LKKSSDVSLTWNASTIRTVYLAKASAYRRKGAEDFENRVESSHLFEEEQEGATLETSGPGKQNFCSRICLIVHRLFCLSSRESLWTVNPRKIKTTSPLSYLLQAAMGQCSTLPEARNSSAARNDGSSGRGDNIRQRLKEEGRTTESLDFNKLTTLSNENTKAVDQRKLHVNVPPNGDHEFAKFPQMDANQPQTRDPEQPANGSLEPMDVDQRDSSQPISLPPPPDNAVRARCYKLNLDSDMVGLSGTKNPHVWLGPFSEPPPQLTYSSSEDSSLGAGATTSVAIQTAQIFRGITISKDGTILSQNARATRSNRGSKTKKGEKSRQAAKIDKAKDLVEEAVMSGKVRLCVRFPHQIVIILWSLA
jgi:hypothetical protein